MGPIASLLQDDPYLKLSADDRLAAYKARRARFDANALKKEAIALEAAIPEPEPVPVLEHVSFISGWIERQKQIHQAALDLKADAPLPLRPSITQIQRACAVHFGFSLAQLCSQRRLASLVRARQIGMYLCKTLNNRSFPEIGRKFGHRDHTTVLYSVHKIEKQIQDDADLAEEIAAITRALQKVLS